MPVRCDVDVEGLSTEAFSELDYVVMGHAFQCQNQVGRLADERIYEGNLVARLRDVPLESLQQVPLVVFHRTFSKTYFLDLIVSRKGIYELKTVASLTSEHCAQLLNYLYLLNLPRGKLLNFRSPKVESEFVNAPLSRQTRTSFLINRDLYDGEPYLFEIAVNMLRDLGTALSVSLYQEILVHFLGGEGVATAMLPMSDGEIEFGNQRFLLATTTQTLRVTCFNRIPDDYEYQLRSLLRFSPLTTTQWININPETVTFMTVAR